MNSKEKEMWLYERLEGCKNRIKRLCELNTPEILIENEWKHIREINKELQKLKNNKQNIFYL